MFGRLGWWRCANDLLGLMFSMFFLVLSMFFAFCRFSLDFLMFSMFFLVLSYL